MNLKARTFSMERAKNMIIGFSFFKLHKIKQATSFFTHGVRAVVSFCVLHNQCHGLCLLQLRTGIAGHVPLCFVLFFYVYVHSCVISALHIKMYDDDSDDDEVDHVIHGLLLAACTNDR